MPKQKHLKTRLLKTTRNLTRVRADNSGGAVVVVGIYPSIVRILKYLYNMILHYTILK
jgi:hypothetical protein